jgi:hypothetical protein
VGLRGAFLQRLPNYFNDSINILFHIIIPKPQHPVPQVLQEARTISIILRLVYMLTAINLNHHALWHAAEICDERTDSMLPAKLISTNLPTLQIVPEFQLRQGWGMPQNNSFLFGCA